MAKDTKLISSLLPQSKLKNIKLSDSSDGKVNIEVDLLFTLSNSENFLSQAFSPPNLRYDSSGQGIFANIRQYLKFVVVLQTLKIEDQVLSLSSLKSIVSQNRPEEFARVPHVIGFSDTVMIGDQTVKEFKESRDAQIDHVVYFDSIFSEDLSIIDQDQDISTTSVMRKVQINGIYPNSVQDLKVSVYTYLDQSDFIGSIPELANIGKPLEYRRVPGRLTNRFVGHPSQYIVLEGGKPSGRSFVLLGADGRQYTGPYHKHSDGRYMVGAEHTDDFEQETLTRLDVSSSKIQDFRGLERFQPKPPETENLIEQFGSVVQETKAKLKSVQEHFLKKQDKFNGLNDATCNLQIGAQFVGDTDGSAVATEAPYIAGTIRINQGEILKQNSKLGFLYPYLNARQKGYALWWGDMFRVVDVKILRRRLTDKFTGWDANGFRSRKPFSQDQEEVIVASNYESLTFDLSNPEDAKPRNSYYDESILMQPPNSAMAFSSPDHPERGFVFDGNKSKNTMAKGRAGDEDFLLRENQTTSYNSGIIMFPWQREIKFSDFSFIQKKDAFRGVFQYGFEITYEDGLTKYITEIVARMTRLTSTLNTFLQIIETLPSDERFDGGDLTTRVGQAGIGNPFTFLNDVVDSFSDGMGIFDAFNYSDDGINKLNHPLFGHFDVNGQIMVDQRQGATRALMEVMGDDSFVGSTVLNSVYTGAWRGHGNRLLKSILGQLLIEPFKRRPEFLRRSQEATFKDLMIFGEQYGLVAKSLADLIGFSSSLYAGNLSDLKSNGGKSANLIKVKKFFGEDLDQGFPNVVEGGVADLRNFKIPTCSILPRPSVTAEGTTANVTQEAIRNAISVEAIKFGGANIAEYTNRVAFFTPNLFYGSFIADISATGYSGLTYQAALDSLDQVSKAKVKKLQKDYDDAVRTINDNITDPVAKIDFLEQAQRQFTIEKYNAKNEVVRKLNLLKDRQENGDFADEDFQLIDDFDELGANQKLAVVDLVTRLLREDRGPFTELDNKTPQELARLSELLYNRGSEFPGISAAAEIFGAVVPNEVEVPTEEECSALSQSQLKALINNQRISFTESVLESEFASLQSAYNGEFSSYVTSLSKNTAGVDDTNVLSDQKVEVPGLADEIQSLRQREAESRSAQAQSAKDKFGLVSEAPDTPSEQRSVEYKKMKEEVEKKKKEREAEKPSYDQGKIIDYPFQLERVIDGETSFGIDPKSGKFNPAIYGNFYVLKRRVLDKERSDLCRTNIYKYVQVTVADALDGLEPGHYGFFPWESSALANSGKYVLEIHKFEIEEPPVPPALEKLESARAREAALEQFIAEKTKEYGELKSDLVALTKQTTELQKFNVEAKKSFRFGKPRGLKEMKIQKQIEKNQKVIQRLKYEYLPINKKANSINKEMNIAKQELVSIRQQIQLLESELSEPPSSPASVVAETVTASDITITGVATQTPPTVPTIPVTAIPPPPPPPAPTPPTPPIPTITVGMPSPASAALPMQSSKTRVGRVTGRIRGRVGY